MIHEHFENIHSTQDYLLQKEVKKGASNLISCEKQSKGHGQYNRSWDSDEASLCFSFTLSPSEVLTLTSLEIGYLLSQYFFQNYEINLKLKWPNDVLSLKKEKIAGILINNANQEQLIVGIGINFFPRNTYTNAYKTPYGFLFKKKFHLQRKVESRKIYEFILSHRLSTQEIIKNWNAQCIHLNQNILFQDQETKFDAKFLSIGSFGEAILSNSEKKLSFYSGSITLY